MSFALHRDFPTDFAILAKACAAAVSLEGNKSNVPAAALRFAERTGASPQVRQALKSAVSGATLDDPTWAGALADDSIVSTFVGSLRASSIMARLTADGIVPAPAQCRLVAATTGFVFASSGEATGIPVSRMALADAPIPLRRAAGIAVLSQELVRATTPAAAQFVDSELRKALSAACDRTLLDIASNSAPGIASTATTNVTAVRDEIRAALNLVNVTASGQLFVVMNPEIANALAAMTDQNGASAFPEMTPIGGALLGCPVLVTDQITNTEVLLLDASGFVGSISAVTIEASREGTIQLDSAPTQNARTSTGTATVSLFQAGLVGLKATAYFALEKARSSAACVITGTAWGGAVTAS